MVEPIRPSEALGARIFPDAVISAFNECIKRNLSNKYAVIKQDEVIDEIRVKNGLAFANLRE